MREGGRREGGAGYPALSTVLYHGFGTHPAFSHFLLPSLFAYSLWCWYREGSHTVSYDDGDMRVYDMRARDYQLLTPAAGEEGREGGKWGHRLKSFDFVCYLHATRMFTCCLLLPRFLPALLSGTRSSRTFCLRPPASQVCPPSFFSSTSCVTLTVYLRLTLSPPLLVPLPLLRRYHCSPTSRAIFSPTSTTSDRYRGPPPPPSPPSSSRRSLLPFVARPSYGPVDARCLMDSFITLCPPPLALIMISTLAPPPLPLLWLDSWAGSRL